MSSFICSKAHFKKMRKETLCFLNTEKYARYTIGLDYDTEKKKLEDFVSYEIFKLYKNNVASVNCQYDTNEKVDYNIFYNEEETSLINTFNIQRAISLYNAYKCTNYQIELAYDTDFINNIKMALGDYIERKLSDNLINYNIVVNEEEESKINKWEYE